MNCKANSAFISLILLLSLCSVNTFASDTNSSSILIGESFFSDKPYISYRTLVVNDKEVNSLNDTSSENKNDFQINWHKVLGWSTLGMMTVTIASGYVVPDGIHCGLAGVTTGLAVATCAEGIYEYGGLISFADGDWKYNTHAILGCLATAGFITTLALADGEGHIATGIASGAAFTVALGVIYF